MTAAEYSWGALVAVLCGLDRTAAFQFMIARPIVAAPLAGWAVGEPAAGLQAGFLLELLWLGRLPVGATIPPDDTQVAVAGTLLAVGLEREFGLALLPAVLAALLVAMPLGKVGQLFDRLARHGNGRLLRRAQDALEADELDRVERRHWQGLLHFALASAATFAVVVGAGGLLLGQIGGLLGQLTAAAETWLWLAFPLVGTAVILGTINVKRSVTLFGASFTGALLMLWLLGEGP